MVKLALGTSLLWARDSCRTYDKCHDCLCWTTHVNACLSRYEATKAEREKVAADIRQRGIRRREFVRFFSELEKLPEAVSEFDETLWGSLVDYVTVGKDKTMTFTLIGGTEMKA